MKLLFDVKNDFDSLYYLPGYNCKVHIVVKDGIVDLNIEDDFLEDENKKWEDEDWEIEEDEWDDEVDCSNCLFNCIYPNGCNYDEPEDEDDYLIDEDLDDESEEAEQEEPLAEPEVEFVNNLQKVDTDGTITKLLTDLIKNGNVGDTTSKSGKAFEKIVKNIAKMLNK